LNRLVDLDEILYGGDGIANYLDYILFNPVHSTIPKWRTFELLRWIFCMKMVALKVTSTQYYLIP
jgi:hypothetical protein